MSTSSAAVVKDETKSQDMQGGHLNGRGFMEAAGTLVSEILRETEVQRGALKQKLVDEVQVHIERMQEESRAAIREVSANCETRLHAMEARLDAAERAARGAEERAAADKAALPSRVAEISRGVDKELAAPERARLASRVSEVSRGLDEARGLLDELAAGRLQGRELVRKGGEDGDTMSQLTSVKIMELRGLCDQRLNAVQQCVEAVAEATHGNSRDLEALERVWSSHVAASREAVNEVRKAHESLRAHVATLNPQIISQYGGGNGEESGVRGVVQAMREQLLNLSMRVSELTTDQEGRVGQQYSEEARAELLRQEQAMERMALSGKAAMKQLDAKQARLQATLNVTQQQMREELAVLIEELRKYQIFVSTHRFPSLGGRYSQILRSPAGSAESTVPSTPDHASRSPTDLGGVVRADGSAEGGVGDTSLAIRSGAAGAATPTSAEMKYNDRDVCSTM